MIVSREVAARVRRNHHELELRVDRLRRAAKHGAELERELSELSSSMRQHWGLVSAVLDAVTEDNSDTGEPG